MDYKCNLSPVFSSFSSPQKSRNGKIDGAKFFIGSNIREFAFVSLEIR